MSSKEDHKSMYSDLSDDELADAYGGAADPIVIEMLKAEERKRSSERALKQSVKSNRIAICSLIVAIISLAVAIIAIIHSSQ